MEFISNMVDSLPVMDINAFEDNMLKPRTTKFFSESNRDYSFIVCVSYSKFFSMHLELPLIKEDPNKIIQLFVSDNFLSHLIL